MQPKIVNSKLVCPKCKSKDLFLIEIWVDMAIHWEQTDGKFDREDGALEPGCPHHVEATCKKCGKRWKPKSANQIDKLITD